MYRSLVANLFFALVVKGGVIQQDGNGHFGLPQYGTEESPRGDERNIVQVTVSGAYENNLWMECFAEFEPGMLVDKRGYVCWEVKEEQVEEVMNVPVVWNANCNMKVEKDGEVEVEVAECVVTSNFKCKSKYSGWSCDPDKTSRQGYSNPQYQIEGSLLEACLTEVENVANVGPPGK